MNLSVIYDPAAGIAATIDPEALIAYGPVAPGEQGADALRSWLADEPIDYAGASPELLQRLFAAYLTRTGHPLVSGAEPSQQPPGPAEPAPGGDQAPLAVAEAQNAGDAPPPPQPADPDPTATTGPTPPESPNPGTADAPAAGQGPGNGEPAAPAADATPAPAAETTAPPVTTTVPCPNCNGTGTITHEGENGPVTNQCGMCEGAGQVTVTT